MGITQLKGNIGSRLDAGSQLLANAAAAKTAPVRAALATFTAAHRALVRAEEAVLRAADALSRSSAALSEKDATQDEAVWKLAAALPADGFARANPFKTFGAGAPSALARKPPQFEAAEARKLAAAIARSPEAGVASKRLARALDTAAQAVLAFEPRAKQAADAYSASLQARAAVERPWERAYSALKLAARWADAEGGTTLFDQLFGQRGTTAKKPAKKARPPMAPRETAKS